MREDEKNEESATLVDFVSAGSLRSCDPIKRRFSRFPSTAAADEDKPELNLCLGLEMNQA